MGFNPKKPPFDDPDIRWAINHAINRKELVKVAYKGGGDFTLLPFPAFPIMKQYTESVAELLQKYPVGTFSLDKTAQIMQSKGYAKDSGGLWAKNGQRLTIPVSIFSLFEDVTPVVVSQLRKGGFDASFKMPSNIGAAVYGGEADAYMWGAGTSVADPVTTLKGYAKGGAPFGWKNDAFDKLVDQMAVTASSDPKFTTLFHDAMDLWLKELPAIPIAQLYARTPWNTTYWTGWPDEQNPYVNTIYIHRTFGMIVDSVRPAGG
jgi:peptide/nickel transport system substrate-binding protein